MTMIQHPFGPLAVMGGGAMAEAIIRGGLAAGVLAAAQIIVCEPKPERRAVFEALGIRTTTRHSDAVAADRPLLLAVKPQSFDELALQLRPHLDRHPCLAVSILAGTGASRIHHALGESGRVVRAMPNTAARLRASTTAIARGPSATDHDLALTERLFSAIGITVTIEESLMDAATAIAGSGPAYVFYLAQAMLDAAAEIGFDSPTASRLVRGTIAGAGQLLCTDRDTPPEVLRAAVTSKGGTTAAAVAVLDQAGVLQAFRQAIIAARDRGRELAQLSNDRRG